MKPPQRPSLTAQTCPTRQRCFFQSPVRNIAAVVQYAWIGARWPPAKLNLPLILLVRFCSFSGKVVVLVENVPPSGFSVDVLKSPPFPPVALNDERYGFFSFPISLKGGISRAILVNFSPSVHFPLSPELLQFAAYNGDQV